MESDMDLETIGWSPTWENAFESANEVGGIPARVIREHKELYELATEMGEAHAEVSGRFLHHTHARDDFPAVRAGLGGVAGLDLNPTIGAERGARGRNPGAIRECKLILATAAFVDLLARRALVKFPAPRARDE